MKIYVLNEDGINNLEVSYEELTDQEFKKAALDIEYGEVYTLKEFEEAFNDGEIDSFDSAIRIF